MHLCTIMTLERLAPRDIVARAITQEILNSDQEYVFLDTTHLKKENLNMIFR